MYSTRYVPYCVRVVSFQSAKIKSARQSELGTHSLNRFRPIKVMNHILNGFAVIYVPKVRSYYQVGSITTLGMRLQTLMTPSLGREGAVKKLF